MKIGIELGKEYRRYGDAVYKMLKRHGYSYVDFSLLDTDDILYTMSESDMKQKLLNEKNLAHEEGIEIWQTHGPWRCPVKDATAEDRRERMEKMKKSLYMTSLLDCRNWVIHPIMPFGLSDKNTPDAEKTWELNLEFMSEILKTAKEYSITVCLENMPFENFSISTPAEILKVVKEINDENFKICFDTGHAICLGESPAEAVRMLGSEIKALHVHDSRVGNDLHLMPYFGICDWKDFANALRETGFSGAFSLETNPPALPDELFEKMSVMLAEVADSIIKK